VHGYFSLGMRLYLPVAETNLTQLWKVPRRKRYIPFLAGLLNDGLFVAVTIILLWLSDLGLIPRVELIHAFGKFLVLVLSFGIIWQFLFFVRTDIYYVVSNLLGCRNLYNDSWNLILNTLSSSLRLRTRSFEIPTKELRIIKLYAPFMLIATVMSISAFTLFGLPILFQIFLEAIQILSLGYKANLLNFVEGLLLTCLTSLHIIGFVYFSAQGFLQLRKRLEEYRISTD
jgi:putative peptide zinc metalloprotease protein